MARGRCAFTETDVKRAVRAVAAAGQLVRGVKFNTDGGFTVLIGQPNDDDDASALSPEQVRELL